MFHIFEHNGVLLRVEYTPGDPPTFYEVYQLDADYKPVGGNLAQMLKELAFVNPDAPELGVVTEAEMFLSRVLGDIEDGSKNPETGI